MTRHAIARAKERHGLTLTPNDIDEIVELCIRGEGVVVPCPAPNATVYLLPYRGVTIFPMIDDASKLCVTILCREFFTAKSRRTYFCDNRRKRPTIKHRDPRKRVKRVEMEW